MNRTLITTTITIVVIELVALLIASGNNDFGVTFGFVSLAGVLVCLVTGIALCIPEKLKAIGKGLLLAAGILLIMGISVCSYSSMHR